MFNRNSNSCLYFKIDIKIYLLYLLFLIKENKFYGQFYSKDKTSRKYIEILF